MNQKLIELRGDKTQVEVAGALKISPSALRSYELYGVTPKRDKMIKLANYYGVTVQELFFSEQN